MIDPLRSLADLLDGGRAPSEALDLLARAGVGWAAEARAAVAAGGDAAGALVRAAKRGVKIVIHTNSPTSADHMIVQGFFLRDWRRILQHLPGARIFGSKKRSVHAKVMIVDDRVTMIGTYNLDPLSEVVNSEVAALVEDAEFAARVRKDIADDIEHSWEYWVKRDEAGNVVEEFGPNKLLKGFNAFWVKLLGRWDWLRRVI